MSNKGPYVGVTVTVPSGAAQSEPFDNVIQLAGTLGGFITPAALDATTTIGFMVSMTRDGAYVPLADIYNNLIAMAVTLNASRGYPLPAELNGFPYFRIWTHAAGVNVNQDSARAFMIFSKA